MGVLMPQCRHVNRAPLGGMAALPRTVPLEADVLSGRVVKHRDVLFRSGLAGVRRGTSAAARRRHAGDHSNVGASESLVRQISGSRVVNSPNCKGQGLPDSIIIQKEVYYWA
jgi:hypothetical protein